MMFSRDGMDLRKKSRKKIQGWIWKGKLKGEIKS